MNVFLEMVYTLFLVFYYCVESFVTLFIPKNFRTSKSIYGEVALVTGAGSGIGRLLGLKLAKLGAKVVLWDVNTIGLEVTKALIEKDGGEAWPYFCDVTDRVQVYETAERVRQDVGNVSLLINNAGIVNGKWFLDTPDEKIEKCMEVNVIAHFWVSPRLID
jgi:all-trans-retinol dehydrogenase (NAD+)